jgi:restriction system protein
MKALFVRADFGKHAEAFLKNGYAAIGWFEKPAKDYSKEAITDNYKIHYPNHSAGTTSQNVGQIFRFCNDIKVGDIVISSYAEGNLLIGIANGLPYFKKDLTCPFYDRINVKWINKLFDRKELSIPTQNTIRSSLTVFNVSQVKEIADMAGIALPQEMKQHFEKVESKLDKQLIYDAIRNQLLRLSDTEFELFVAYTLQSLGFEAQQMTGRVGDGGIDFEGILDVLGVASVRLQVQVKRYTSATIGEKEIRSFRGALKRDHQGTFITLSSFQKKAIESARDESKVAINLIDGIRLIEIFIEQYDKVIQQIEENENLELLNKLKFRKVVIPL